MPEHREGKISDQKDDNFLVLGVSKKEVTAELKTREGCTRLYMKLDQNFNKEVDKHVYANKEKYLQPKQSQAECLEKKIQDRLAQNDRTIRKGRPRNKGFFSFTRSRKEKHKNACDRWKNDIQKAHKARATNLKRLSRVKAYTFEDGYKPSKLRAKARQEAMKEKPLEELSKKRNVMRKAIESRVKIINREDKDPTTHERMKKPEGKDIYPAHHPNHPDRNPNTKPRGRSR